MSKNLWTIFAVLIFVLTACGSSDESDAVSADDLAPASAESSSSEESSTAGVTEAEIEEAQAAYREFTDCMLEEGIVMAPAVFDDSGMIDLDAQIKFFEDLGPEEFEEQRGIDVSAVEARCTPENGDVLLARITPAASESQEMQDSMAAQINEDMVKLARCMREEFPDFPDPVAIDFQAMIEGSEEDFSPFPGIDVYDPVYATALDTCDESLGIESFRRR